MLALFLAHMAIVAALTLGLGDLAVAQEPAAAREPSPMASPAPSSGVTIRLLYTGEAGVNPYGGIRNGAAYVNTADARLEVDTAKAFGLPDGTTNVRRSTCRSTASTSANGSFSASAC